MDGDEILSSFIRIMVNVDDDDDENDEDDDDENDKDDDGPVVVFL